MVAITTSDNLATAAVPTRRPARLVARLVLPLALLLAVAARAFLIVRAPGVLDGDEALVGLQAQSIAAGSAHPLPVFFYGQHYMGSLEAYLCAAVFRLIGPSVPALRLAPLLCALLLVLLTYDLARRVAGRQPAGLAALLAALPPLYVGVWSIKARGGYVETLALGTALLIVTHRLLYGPGKRLGPLVPVPVRRERAVRYAYLLLWGLLAGLLFWTSPVGAPYLLTCAGALLVAAARRSRLLPRLGVFAVATLRRSRALPGAGTGVGGSAGVGAIGGWRGLAARLAPLLVVVGGVAIGGLPLWVDNVATRGATFTYLLSGTGGDNPLKRVPRVTAYFFTAVVPKLTGAWAPWNAVNVVALGVLLLTLYAVAVAYLLARLAAGRRGVLGYRARPRHGQGLLLSFALVTAGLFCLSSFGAAALPPPHFDAATRYALPLASVLPVAAGMLLWRLWRLWQPLGAALLAAVLLTAALGYATARPLAVFQSEYWAKLPPGDVELELATFLQAHGIRDVWMNHWAGYPLMFYTQGRIYAADYNDVVLHPGVNRLPWTLRRAAADPHTAYVLVTAMANPPLIGDLKKAGATYALQRIGPYLVFYNLSRPVPPSEVAPGIDFAF